MTSGYKIDHVPTSERCCELHNIHCEPAGDLCCSSCAEVDHYHGHPVCVLDRCACASELAHLCSTQPGYAGARIGMREPATQDTT